MNLSDARAVARFAKVFPQDGKGSVRYKVHMPGHDGKRYLVLIRHEDRTQVNPETGEIIKFKALTGECLFDSERLGTPRACPSTSTTNSPCFHLLGALVAIAKLNKLSIAFAGSASSAESVINFHAGHDPKIFRVAQHGSYHYVWAVTWKSEPSNHEDNKSKEAEQ